MKIFKIVLWVLMFIVVGLGVDYFFYQENKKINEKRNDEPIDIPEIVENLNDNILVNDLYLSLTNELLLKTLFYNEDNSINNLNNEDILAIAYDYLKLNNQKEKINCNLFESLKEYIGNNTVCDENIDWYYNSENKNTIYLLKAAIEKIFGNISYTFENFDMGNNKCFYINGEYTCVYKENNKCLNHSNVEFVGAKIYKEKITINVKYLVDGCNSYYIDRVYYADASLKKQIIPKKDIPSTILNPTKKYGIEYQITLTEVNDSYVWNNSKSIN